MRARRHRRRQLTHDRAGAQQRHRRLATRSPRTSLPTTTAIARTTTARARSSSNRWRTCRSRCAGRRPRLRTRRSPSASTSRTSAADNAGTVTVQIDVPAGTTIGSASLTNGSCTSGAASIECTLTPLGGGLDRERLAVAHGFGRGQRGTARRRLGRLLRHEQCQRHGRPGRRRRVAAASPRNGRSPPASGGGGGGSFGFLLLLASHPCIAPAAGALESTLDCRHLGSHACGSRRPESARGYIQGLLPNHGRGSRREPGRDQARLSPAGA